eukprot:COSAG04_NODE_6176_length_1392_cov_1.177108_2_plen_137_part_00
MRALLLLQLPLASGCDAGVFCESPLPRPPPPPLQPTPPPPAGRYYIYPPPPTAPRRDPTPPAAFPGGKGCEMDPVSGDPGPKCDSYPAQANATSSSTTLIWEAMHGGLDGLGGDVFLSTTLNMGCGPHRPGRERGR